MSASQNQANQQKSSIPDYVANGVGIAHDFILNYADSFTKGGLGILKTNNAVIDYALNRATGDSDFIAACKLGGGIAGGALVIA